MRTKNCIICFQLRQAYTCHVLIDKEKIAPSQNRE
jgi:hypothetical protein